MVRDLHERLEKKRDELLASIPKEHRGIARGYWDNIYELFFSYEEGFNYLKSVRIANTKLKDYIKNKCWENISFNNSE